MYVVALRNPATLSVASLFSGDLSSALDYLETQRRRIEGTHPDWNALRIMHAGERLELSLHPMHGASYLGDTVLFSAPINVPPAI